MAKDKKKAACGRCFWLWVGKKAGFWLPLTAHECGAGCTPSKPLRTGKRRFEVLSKACRKITKKQKKSGMLDCMNGECEWTAVEKDGKLVWKGVSRCQQGCDCGGPPFFPPTFPGEVFLDFCVEATAKGKAKKAAKKKAKKKGGKK